MEAHTPPERAGFFTLTVLPVHRKNIHAPTPLPSHIIKLFIICYFVIWQFIIW